MKRLILLLSVAMLSVGATFSSQAQSVVENYEWTHGTEAPQFGKMNLPFNDMYLASRRCKFIRPTMINNRCYYLVFSSLGHIDDSSVEDVYLIPDGLRNSVSYREPPKVKKLRYHNLGGGGEAPDFCSVILEWSTPNDDGTFSRVVAEDRIQDECANLLIDVIAGTGKFRYVNPADIYYGILFEETTEPGLAKTKIY